MPGPAEVIGLLRLARGRADGLALFGDTPAHFLASLAPFIALPLVGALLQFVMRPSLGPIGDFLASQVALLAPPVLSWELARLWGRQDAWLRYAVAFNWTMWAIPMLGFLLLMLVGLLIPLGLPAQQAGLGLSVVLAIYGLWLHWFLARRGLGLSAWRAVVLVLVVNIVTGLLVLSPALIQAYG